MGLVSKTSLSTQNKYKKIIGVLGNSNKNGTELAIGALMPWANKLWFVTYTARNGSGFGGGSGLNYIDEYDNIVEVDVDDTNGGCWAGRFFDVDTESIYIGRWKVDKNGVSTRILSLPDTLRVTAITKSFNVGNLYFLGMEGELFEVNTTTLASTQVADLSTVLNIPGDAHFKDMFMRMQGATPKRLFVCNNENTNYSSNNGGLATPEYTRGRLASWAGGASSWTILNNTASWAGIGGSDELEDNMILAVGIDDKGAILGVANPLDSSQWTFKRLPTASRVYNHWWQAEWMRIRPIESERFLMDSYGMYYMVSPSYMGEDKPLIEPISRHLRITPDFASWKGYLVLGGDQSTPENGGYRDTPQSSSGLLFTHTDDLWSFGKPQGYSDLWRNESVTSGTSSQEMLINGFDKKTIHIQNNGTADIQVKIEICHRSQWYTYKTVNATVNTLITDVMPDGLKAEWLRLTPLANMTNMTAWVYCY